MTLKIEGMGCMHCVKKITEALQATGAEVEKVEIGSAEIKDFADVDALKAAVENAGFSLVSVS